MYKSSRFGVRCVLLLFFFFVFFFFNDTATTEIYTLSLHDALPICGTHAGKHTAYRQVDNGFNGSRVTRAISKDDERDTLQRPSRGTQQLKVLLIVTARLVDTNLNAKQLP